MSLNILRPSAGDGLFRHDRRLDVPVLFFIVAAYYLLLNWQFTGPTYLTDEIGYLSNAAFFAGSRIDASSSYHFGYSLFLVPSFLLFEDTAAIWKSVLVTNALIFSVAFSVLYLIAEYFCVNRLHRLGCVVLAAAYPAYPVMSGYAFSQPAFVLVFLSCCLMLLRFSRTSYAGQLAFGLLVGFLYWIHPTALPVAIAAAVIGLVAVVSDRRTLLPVFVSVFVAVLMIAVYKWILHPWLIDAMTPETFDARTHYPTISDRFLVLFSFSAVVDFLTRFLGQIAYLIVSTLSIIVFGVFYIPKLLLDNHKDNNKNENVDYFYLFVFFSLFGLFFTISAFFTKNYSASINAWFYGRYVEGLVLPILLISLINNLDRRTNLSISLSIIISFIILFSFSDYTNTWLNMVMVPGFWPAALPVESGIAWWFSIGAVGCVVGICLPRTLQISLLVLSFVVCTAAQIDWHRNSHRITSTPSGLQTFVRNNLTPGSCIGIGSGPTNSPIAAVVERLNLYSYYLYDYHYQRMSPEDWFATCNGYYLSYWDEEELLNLGAIQVGMEAKTGLFVYAKNAARTTDGRSYGPDFLLRLPGDGMDRFTLSMSAADILPFNGVGTYGGDALRTTGRSGFLFYGPYIYVEPGLLKFEVSGIANNVDGAWIDIASNGGGTIHAKFPVQTTNGKIGILAEGEFTIPMDVRDLEIRLKVQEDSDIQFQHYDLILPN